MKKMKRKLCNWNKIGRITLKVLITLILIKFPDAEFTINRKITEIDKILKE